MTFYNPSNTLSELLRSLLRNGLLPGQDNLFTTADLTSMLGEEALSRIVPFITGLNEGYLLKSIWYPLVPNSSYMLSTAPTSGNPQGSPAPQYNFPPDSVGRRLHDVSVYWGGGPSARQYKLDIVTDYQAGTNAGIDRGVYIEGDHFFLYPAVFFQNAVNMRVSYRGQPMPLCDDSGTSTSTPTGAQVTTVSSVAATGSTPSLIQATFSPSATTLSTWSTGYQVNVVDGNPGYSTKVAASTYSTQSNNVLYFKASDVTDFYGNLLIAPNDWVSDVGYSPVLQLPRECAQMAVYAVLSKAMAAMNNEQWQLHEARYKQLEEAAKVLFSPRVDDSPKQFTPRQRGRFSGGWY